MTFGTSTVAADVQSDHVQGSIPSDDVAHMYDTITQHLNEPMQPQSTPVFSQCRNLTEQERTCHVQASLDVLKPSSNAPEPFRCLQLSGQEASSVSGSMQSTFDQQGSPALRLPVLMEEPELGSTQTKPSFLDHGDDVCALGSKYTAEVAGCDGSNEQLGVVPGWNAPEVKPDEQDVLGQDEPMAEGEAAETVPDKTFVFDQVPVAYSATNLTHPSPVLGLASPAAETLAATTPCFVQTTTKRTDATFVFESTSMLLAAADALAIPSASKPHAHDSPPMDSPLDSQMEDATAEASFDVHPTPSKSAYPHALVFQYEPSQLVDFDGHAPGMGSQISPVGVRHVTGSGVEQAEVAVMKQSDVPLGSPQKQRTSPRLAGKSSVHSHHGKCSCNATDAVETAKDSPKTPSRSGLIQDFSRFLSKQRDKPMVRLWTPKAGGTAASNVAAESPSVRPAEAVLSLVSAVGGNDAAEEEQGKVAQTIATGSSNGALETGAALKQDARGPGSSSEEPTQVATADVVPAANVVESSSDIDLNLASASNKPEQMIIKEPAAVDEELAQSETQSTTSTVLVQFEDDLDKPKSRLVDIDKLFNDSPDLDDTEDESENPDMDLEVAEYEPAPPLIRTHVRRTSILHSTDVGERLFFDTQEREEAAVAAKLKAAEEDWFLGHQEAPKKASSLLSFSLSPPVSEVTTSEKRTRSKRLQRGDKKPKVQQLLSHDDVVAVENTPRSSSKSPKTSPVIAIPVSKGKLKSAPFSSPCKDTSKTLLKAVEVEIHTEKQKSPLKPKYRKKTSPSVTTNRCIPSSQDSEYPHHEQDAQQLIADDHRPTPETLNQADKIMASNPGDRSVELEPQSRVWAARRYRDKSFYFVSTLLGFKNDRKQSQVEWLDGDTEWVETTNVFPFRLEPGHSVFVLLLLTNVFKPAFVSSHANEDQYYWVSLMEAGSRPKKVHWNQLALSQSDLDRQMFLLAEQHKSPMSSQTSQKLLVPRSVTNSPLSSRGPAADILKAATSKARMAVKRKAEKDPEVHRESPSVSVKKSKTLTLSTPRRQSLFTGHQFMMTAASTENQHIVDDLRNRITKAGGEIIDLDQHDKLHQRRGIKGRYLLAPGSCRTSKYFLALAANIPRLSFEWADQCLKQGKLLDTEPFLLPNGMVDRRQVGYCNHDGIFHEKTFYFTPGLVSHEKEVWFSIVKSMGGHVVQKRPIPGKGKAVDYYLAFGDSVEPQILKNATELGIPVLKKDWLFRCLIDQQLAPVGKRHRFE